MADLTANAYLRIWGEATTDVWNLDSSIAQTIYKGQPMYLDITADTVNVTGFLDAQTVAADDIFIGIAAEGSAVRAIGASETDDGSEIVVYMEPTIVGFPGSVFTDADVGDTIYMSDSATLSATAGDNPEIGKLVRVKDGFQYVRLSSPTICASA
jgi:hypothetical protein